MFKSWVEYNIGWLSYVCMKSRSWWPFCECLCNVEWQFLVLLKIVACWNKKYLLFVF